MNKRIISALSISVIAASNLPVTINHAAAETVLIEEIIVTARKRAEDVVDVPLAISALSGNFIERAGIAGIDDIAANTPGLTFQSFNGGGLSSPVIRGLAQTTIASPITMSAFFSTAYLLTAKAISISLCWISSGLK